MLLDSGVAPPKVCPRPQLCQVRLAGHAETLRSCGSPAAVSAAAANADDAALLAAAARLAAAAPLAGKPFRPGRRGPAVGISLARLLLLLQCARRRQYLNNRAPTDRCHAGCQQGGRSCSVGTALGCCTKSAKQLAAVPGRVLRGWDVAAWTKTEGPRAAYSPALERAFAGQAA